MAGIAQPAVERVDAVRRGRLLGYFTIVYNCLEAVIAIAAGIAASSVALIGFGLDSLIEVSSAGAALWRLSHEWDAARRARAERRSLRIVGVCFAVLAAYITWESAECLYRREAPERSLPGIVLAAVSVVVMPLLARAKCRVAGALASGALRADARQTGFCAYLSAILLGGLAVNALFGWWWADPVAGLVMVPIIASEGSAALKGKSCGCDSCHV